MPLDDPSSWAQGIGALKTTFDAVRAAISTLKDIRSLGGGTEVQQKTIDVALGVATNSTAIAEAELAKAFGYELCKCEFPPAPMLTVGYLINQMDGKPGAGRMAGDPVYECPKCGYNNAGPFTYERIAPDRAAS